MNMKISGTAARKIQASQGTVAYTGRPIWLTEQSLDELAAEATALRGTAEQNRQLQFGARAGQRALAFGRSPEILGLIGEFTSRQCSCQEGTYLYYERPGAGIVPHIDRPDFTLQILLMLRHTGYAEKRSALAIFPDGPKSAVYFPLEPGELILFRAASVTHGRTATAEGEFVNLLGLGYA
jgi:hypothetical protein